MSERVVIMLPGPLSSYAFSTFTKTPAFVVQGMRSNEQAIRSVIPRVECSQEMQLAEGITGVTVTLGKVSGMVLVVTVDAVKEVLDTKRK